MSGWTGSDRRQRLPDNWPVLRKRVLRRDGQQCTHRNADRIRCLEVATEVDHVIPGDNHDESNLTSLCKWHHGKKSGREGAQASNAKRREINRRFLRSESHPGFL